MSEPARRRERTRPSLQLVPPVVIAGVAVYLLFRATQLPEPNALRTFLCGVILFFCFAAILRGQFVAKRRATEREQQMEVRIAQLTERLRKQERDLKGVRQDVEYHIAIKTMLDARGQADDHARRGWIKLVNEE